MKPLDRRVVRTRRMLHDALIALVLEKDYDAITVQDITDRADLRRATFYLHYRTKEELLLATLDGMFADVVKQIEAETPNAALGGKTALSSFVIMFQHAAAYSSFYQALLKGQGAAFAPRRFRDFFAAYMLRALSPLPAPNIPVEVLASYVAGAELELLTWWLENDMPYPPEQMAKLTQKLILSGLNGALDPTLLEALTPSTSA